MRKVDILRALLDALTKPVVIGIRNELILAAAVASACATPAPTNADFGDVLLDVAAPTNAFEFGSSVDISGDRVVIGGGGLCCVMDEVQLPLGAEEAYVYDLAGEGNPLHILKPENGLDGDLFGMSVRDGDWFGKSVAVFNNLAIIGAPYDDSAGEDAGAAYLFDINTGQQLHRLVPSNAMSGERHGYDVAIHGNRAIVGSLNKERDAESAVHVFDTVTGEELRRIEGDNRTFGTSVAIQDNVAIVGTTFVGGEFGGSIHAFDVETGNQLWEVISENRSDHFGASIDISGTRTIVGAPYATRLGTDNIGRPIWAEDGAAHVFDTQTGEHLFELTRPTFDGIFAHLGAIMFGESVAIDGNLAVVGARNDNQNSTPIVGATHVFDVTSGQRVATIWGDQIGDQRLTNDSGFGQAVAISGTTAFVNSPRPGLGHALDLSGTPPPIEIEPIAMIPGLSTPGVLQPGDADRDGDFDRFDLIQAISSDKYQTGELATWGEGDWDCLPFPCTDPPPQGNGEFDRLDMVLAASMGLYQTGPYAEGKAPSGQSFPLVCCGEENDETTSLVYDPETGEFALDAPFRQELTTLNIDSAAGIFTEEGANRLRGPSGGAFDLDTDHTIFYARMGGQSGATFGSFSLGRVAEPDLSLDFLLSDLTALGSLDEQGLIESIDLVYRGDPSQQLKPGDADLDFKFDQLDLVKVLAAGKYLTGEPATWGDGDWDGAPARRRNEIPVGDGQFNQLDVIAALSGGLYLMGPYAALSSNGASNDNQTSIIYDASTGELAVDAPRDHELTSIKIDSVSGIFTGNAAANLTGSFDNDRDNNIFKATFGSSFGSLSFGNVARSGLSEEFITTDLTVVGSLAEGGDLGSVDLIYIAVPEPASALLLAVAATLIILRTVNDQLLRTVREFSFNRVPNGSRQGIQRRVTRSKNNGCSA